MSRSRDTSAILRWVVLVLVVGLVVIVSYAAIEATGWVDGGAVSVSIVAAAGTGFLALVIVRHVLSRRSGATSGIDARLDRIATPITLPESRNSLQQSVPRELDHGSDTRDDTTAKDQVDTESQSGVGMQPTATPTSPAPDSHVDETALGFAPPEPDEPSVQSVPSRPMTAITPPNPQGGQPPGDRVGAGSIGGAGLDANRLAAVLNRYQQPGVKRNSRAAPPASELPHVDRALENTYVWSQLVGVYGAESIDLRDIDAGTCSITLRSGNLVVYVPQYRRWVWVAFTRPEATASTGDEEPLANQSGISSPRDAGTPSMLGASPGPSGTRTRTGTHEEAEDGLMRLARSSIGGPISRSRRRSRSARVEGMAQTLSSQHTPAAYEEALFVTEGLLLGAAYGKRVVPYEELVWVVEAATGHLMQEQSLGRFLGDLVDRSYPRHMDVLSALAVPSPSTSQSAAHIRDKARLMAAQSAEDEVPDIDGTVVDLTDTEMRAQHQTAANQPS